MELNQDLDADALHQQFCDNGRIHIGGVLAAPSARALYSAIRNDARWNFVFFANDRHFDLDAEGWRKLDPEKKRTTEEIVHAQAAGGFSYMYDAMPIYDLYYSGKDMPASLKELFEFLNGEAFLSLMRRMTGAEDIAFADAQITRYGPGHFLTTHNDAVEGKNRRAAFVLNMTPEWREDWGGYLNFFDDNGHVEEGFKPAFNALNVFAVPARHSVGYVSPFAASPRYSITGWLRAGVDPARVR